MSYSPAVHAIPYANKSTRRLLAAGFSGKNRAYLDPEWGVGNRPATGSAAVEAHLNAFGGARGSAAAIFGGEARGGPIIVPLRGTVR